VLRGWWLELALAVTFVVSGTSASAATVQNVRTWSGPEGTRVVFELVPPSNIERSRSAIPIASSSI